MLLKCPVIRMPGVHNFTGHNQEEMFMNYGGRNI